MPRDSPVTGKVFVQADTVLGYRFWDHTGVVANEFAKRFQSVGYVNTGVTGVLVCSAPINPEDSLQEIQVSTQRIWLAYREGVDTTTIRQESSYLVDWIARAIFVSRFSRIGLRIYMMWGGDSEDEVIGRYRSQILRAQDQGWSELGAVNAGEFVIYLTADRMTARVGLTPARNMRTEVVTKIPGVEQIEMPPGIALPDYSIMLDADLYESRLTESVDVKPHLTRAIEFLDGKLVPFIERMLDGEDK